MSWPWRSLAAYYCVRAICGASRPFLDWLAWLSCEVMKRKRSGAKITSQVSADGRAESSRFQGGVRHGGIENGKFLRRGRVQSRTLRTLIFYSTRSEVRWVWSEDKKDIRDKVWKKSFRSVRRAGNEAGWEPARPITWRWPVEISGLHARVVVSDHDSIATRYHVCGRTGEILSCGPVRFEVVRPA